MDGLRFRPDWSPQRLWRLSCDAQRPQLLTLVGRPPCCSAGAGQLPTAALLAWRPACPASLLHSDASRTDGWDLAATLMNVECVVEAHAAWSPSR
jgi:hypothetical protein